MVDFDNENCWTTVVRRRTSKHRSGSKLGSRPSQFPVFQAQLGNTTSSLKQGATVAAPIDVLNEGKDFDDEEPRILLRLKRSMLRVQESQFFRRLLDQTTSPLFLDNLRRAAAPLSEFELCIEQCTGDARSVRTAFSQGKGEGESAFERDVESASQSFEPGREMLSDTLVLKWFAHRVIHKRSEVAFRLESSSITSDKIGNLEAEEVEVKDGTRNVTDLYEPSRKEKPCAGIGIKNWQLQVVVYGLGKIADSEVSRCQLAVILLLKQNFPWISGIEIYDPILSQSECRVIQSLGCSTTNINEEGKRSIEKPTVFYMPHCEDWLYDNVLQANWTPVKLRQLVILGNSFRTYQERWSSFRGSRSTPPPTYVLELQQIADEIPLEGTSSLELPAFNNLSWHFFPGL